MGSGAAIPVTPEIEDLEMRVALFIPCFVDQLYPQVGLATVAVLEKFGVEVVYPESQTCCGQPFANAGFGAAATPLARRFVEIFADFEAVVAPSGSCVAMVRCHFEELLGASTQLDALRQRTFELCEFLTDVLNLDALEGRFPHRVGLHQSCHALRELGTASSSERIEDHHDRAGDLLATLEGLELSVLERPDECCGFGGTFAVSEEAVSCRMGLDRLSDHERAGSEVVTSVDMSCLMHMEGLIRRNGRGGSPRVMHVAEILASALA